MYTIGQVSEMLSIPIRTIRYYEKIDLVKPCHTDAVTNYRYYSMAEIFQLDLVRCLGKVLGMPLKKILEYIKKRNDPETLKQYLKEQAKDIDAQIDTLLLRKDFLLRKLQAVTLRELTETFVPDISVLPGRRLCLKPANPANTEEAILSLRKCVIEAGNRYDHNLFLLRDIDPETLEISSAGQVLIGLDCDINPTYSEYFLSGGKYARLTYQNRDQGRDRALKLLTDYIKLSGLRPADKLVFKSTLLDATSVYSDDYYFELELRVE